MKTLFRMAGKLFFSAFLFSVIILSSCSDDTNPITPNLPPNTFCDISGTYSMTYKGFGTIYDIVKPKGIMMYSYYKDSDGETHHLGINVYFKDGLIKTGTFPILKKNDSNLADFAVAFFETGLGSSKQTFISESGTLILSEVSSLKFKGTFNFIAKDSTGKAVTVKNGIVEIIN